MRIVTVSDLHLDWETMGVPRLAEGSASLEEAAEHAMEIEAEWFFCLGDIADPDREGATIAAMMETQRVALRLAWRGINSVWLAGNHDVDEHGSGRTTLGGLAVLESEVVLPKHGRIYAAERPRLIDLSDEFALLCLPFAAVSHAYNPAVEAALMMSHARAERKKVIVASHLQVPGIVPGEETTEMPRGRDMPYPFGETRNAVARLQGHYHRRETFDPKDGGPVVHVIGSSMRLTAHDEDATPGYVVIETP